MHFIREDVSRGFCVNTHRQINEKKKICVNKETTNADVSTQVHYITQLQSGLEAYMNILSRPR